MTLTEFKAWFEGFTEDMGSAPNKRQWERIQARVKEITGHSVSYPVYIDRYVAPVRPYWDRVWCGGVYPQAVGVGSALRSSGSATAGLSNQAYNGSLSNQTFDSHAAMSALGKADALALKAAYVTQRGIDAALPYATGTVWHTGQVGANATTMGTDTTPVVTEEYVAEVFVPVNTLCTGIAVLNGSAVAGNMQCALYDSNGGIITTTASTAASGIAAFQKVPWAAAQNLKGPATYYVGVQNNNVANRLRTHAIGNFGASKKTSQTYGTFTALTVPTTFTAGQGPVADLY